MWTKDEVIVLPIMLGAILLISLLLGFILKNKSEKIRNIPLMIIAGIILVLEVIKQARSIINGTYSGWTVPLHFCSFFMVWFPLAQFTKGKTKQIGMACSLMTSALMFALFYFQPSTIIGNSTSNVFGSFGDFHTFTFHHLVILYLFCFLSLRVYKPKKSDFFWATLALTGYFVLGVSMANILDVNFTNFLHSNIPFMEQLRLARGQGVYLLTMCIGGLAGANAVLFLFYVCYNKLNKLKQQKKNQQE